MKKRRWLLTAFEPFAGRPDNHSQAVVHEIQKLVKELEASADGDDAQLWPFEFHYRTLPVEYDRCYEVLKTELAALTAELDGPLEGVLSIGEGAEDFKLETQANNVDDVPNLADNAGVVRVGKKIIARLSKEDSIPLRFPFEAFQRIRISKNPGFYICNHLCARMGDAFASDANAPYFGFIHVPRTGMGGAFTADVCAAIIVNGFRRLVQSTESGS